MIRLILVRHALTDWNQEGRCHGVTDVPLGAYGLKMAETLVVQMDAIEFNAVYFSDLQRAQMTMQVILHGRNLPLFPSPRLRERDYGKMEGKTDLRGLELWPLEVETWLKDHTYTIEGGESYADFYARVVECFKEILSESEGKTVLIVAHGGSLRVILSCLGEKYHTPSLDVPVTHACFSDLLIRDDELFIQQLNSCEHLVGLK